MKTIFSLIISGALVILGHAQTRNVLVGTNNAVVQPTNFWSADASNARIGLGLGSAATNPSSAFQPSSSVLSNLASSNGLNLTNIPVSNVVGALATNGSATNLTNFPASLLRTNGNGFGLTNLNASNITGIIPASNISTISLTNISGTLAVASGGTGATNAGGARTNLGLGASSDVLFNTVFVNGGPRITGDGIFWSTNSDTGLQLGNRELYADGFVVFSWQSNALELSVPITFGSSGISSSTRTNLGLGWSALTNTNAATSLLGFSTNGAIVYTGPTNQLQFTNRITAPRIDVTSEIFLADEVQVTFDGAVYFDTIGFKDAIAVGGTRTNLGLGWSALTNANAGTGLVSVNTNGEVVSPTNFWQAAPINTRVQNFTNVTASATNNATNARNLFVFSLAPTVSGVTNTIALPTNPASTFEGDVATVTHLATNTNAVTAVRQLGGTNLITLNRLEETVQFIYRGGQWRLSENISHVEPIYFSGTNAAANAAASRTNLGLGTTNVVEFGSFFVNGSFFSVSNAFEIYRPLWVGDRDSTNNVFEFEVDSDRGIARTNLGLPLAALTNTSNATFQQAIFTTNAAPTNSANVNSVGFNTAVAWMEVSIVTNSVTNSYRIPLFR